MPLCQAVEKLVFDSLTEVKGAVKTSNSHSSAYMDTVESELRSKSKCIAQQALIAVIFCAERILPVSTKETTANHQNLHFDG